MTCQVVKAGMPGISQDNIKPDELELWQLLLRWGPYGVTVRDLLAIYAPTQYIAPKRAWYLCEKWSRQNLYEWGVTLDLGWVTPFCRLHGYFGHYCLPGQHATRA